MQIMKKCIDCSVPMTEPVGGKGRWRCVDCRRTMNRNLYHQRYKDSRKIQTSAYYKKNREKMLKKQSENGRRRNQELRLLALEAYGSKCECCGELNKEFLGIDHINGGGNNHRKEIKKSIYLFLKKENYPKGFRILCHNCNMSRGFYGYCPHELKNN